MRHLGAVSDPVVLFSAVGGLAVFVCFFVHVLLCVPQHWGVPYNTRLKRHLAVSTHGFVIEILNGVFSITSCVLFVMETYDRNSNDYDFLVKSFSLETAFNGFFLCNFLVHLYMAVDKLSHLKSVQALVDIVTVCPSYVVLLDGLQMSGPDLVGVYLGLKVTRVFRVARLFVTISFFVQGPSLAFDHSRQILVLRSQFVRRCLETLVVIFIMAGLTHFLVEVQRADWGTGEGEMPFHDALYYIVVSFSTVGYGDISPSTPLSRLLIAALIMSLFFCAPLVTNVLVNLIRVTPKHSGRLAKGFGTGHIVVGCDSSCLRVVSVLLRELLAPDSMAFHTAHVVIVVPQEPDLEWEALLCLQPEFAVTYLNGDLRSSEDLRRARVEHARACFVLSDRLAADTEAQDKTALVRALCAHEASPPEASVLCMVTHAKSKGRLVRLGVPGESVVCYDEVMEALVAHACLHAGFSTVWANTLSCMPEVDALLKVRAAEEAKLKSPLTKRTFETEMEYLRSLQRVMIRFHLDAFTGEYAGDVAIELYRECDCTLLALICTTCSGGHKDGVKCGDFGGRDPVQKRCARVHPDYHGVLKSDDVGVFIGASQKAGDRIARYCAARASMGKPSTTAMERPIPHPKKAPPPRLFQRIARRLPCRLLCPGVSELSAPPNTKPWQARGRRPTIGTDHLTSFGEEGDVGAPALTSLSTSSLFSAPLSASASGRRLNRSQSKGSGRLPLSVSPLGERLLEPPPGFVLVITQSLSFALGVLLTLCEADVSFEGGSSAVTVLCSPAWWDPAVDDGAERELAARFPSVRVRRAVPEIQGLLECRADSADLVCVVSSRVSEKHEAASADPEDSGGIGGVGDYGGRDQGSDGWAMGVVVDVLGVVPASTRVVVRFDDPASAEQHQVISAHVRRRAATRERERREREAERARETTCREEKGFEPALSAGETVVQTVPAHCKLSRENTLRGISGMASGGYSCALRELRGLDLDAADAGNTAFFDDRRGVSHEGFDDFFATMSGYASGDVVIGNAAELLLLQTMLASDIQSLMNDVLNLASRVAVEALWPKNTRGRGSKRPRPATYGEAYQSLLRERDLLALGIHRPPARRHRGSSSAGAAGVAAARCPGGSRYLSITCPIPSFPLQDGDFLFVLRPPSDVSAAADDTDPIAVPVIAGEGHELSPKEGVLPRLVPDKKATGEDWTWASTKATTPKSGPILPLPLPSPLPSPLPLPPHAVPFSSVLEATGAAPCEDEAGANALSEHKTPCTSDAESDSDATRQPKVPEPSATTADAAETNQNGVDGGTGRTEGLMHSSMVEWALGLLVRTSPLRVDCSKGSGDVSLSVLRQRVVEVAAGAATTRYVSPDASLREKDELKSSGSSGGFQEGGARLFSAPTYDDGKSNDKQASVGHYQAAVLPTNLTCGGCRQTLGSWEKGSARGPLALDCGHVTCVDCLEGGSSLETSQERRSNRWSCPSCDAVASAALPLV